MGVIVISLRTHQSTGENFGCTWEHLGGPATSLGGPATSLAALTTSLGALRTSHGPPTTNLGAPRITVKHLGKLTSSLGPLLVQLEIIATTYRSTIFKTHVFSLYSHLSVYIANHLHTIYLDWLQAVL